MRALIVLPEATTAAFAEGVYATRTLRIAPLAALGAGGGWYPLPIPSSFLRYRSFFSNSLKDFGSSSGYFV